ncbi:MAG: M23 family metallopeptidase, partial [Sphingobacteriia bacterium]
MRALYTYDPETCTYVRQRPTPRSWLRRNGAYVVLALALATGFSLLFSYWYASPEVKQMRKQNRELIAHRNSVRKSLDAMMADLQHMQAERAKLHKTLTNTDLPTEDQPDAISATRLASHEQIRIQALALLVQHLQQRADRTAVQQRVLLELVRKKRPELGSLPLYPPLKQLEVICGFGQRVSSITRSEQLHDGLDLNAQLGTAVHAAAAGQVGYVGPGKSGQGTILMIDHGNGYQTEYRHLQQAQVHPGQYVRAGQQIALSGKSGLVRGPHLHFTIWKEGKVVDP